MHAPERRQTPRNPDDTTLVGRADVLDRIGGLRAAAGQGALSVLVVEGEPGIGKTAVVEAAARTAGDEGWTCSGCRGSRRTPCWPTPAWSQSSRRCGPHLSSLTGRQRDVLQAAVGWTDPEASGDRFGVAAATLGLLGAAAEAAPLLVVVDDLPWLDQESAEALLFAARRLRHDRAAFLLTRREGAEGRPAVEDADHLELAGLVAKDAAALLGRDVAPGVAERLATDTAGNPLALLECGRLLTPVQRAGAAALPTTLPVPARLREIYERELSALPADGWAAVLLAAASHDQALAPVAAALADRGLDTGRCLDQAAGVLELTGPVIAFRHPLLRSAAWHRAGGAERRQAHAALAAGLPAGAARTWHRAEAAFGYDRELALELAATAQSEGARRGYAAASVAYERAARLMREPAEAAALLAPGGRECPPGRRRRTRAPAGGGGPGRCGGGCGSRHRPVRPRAARGVHRHVRPGARAAAGRSGAAERAGGRLLLRVLVELGGICYLLDDQEGNWQPRRRGGRPRPTRRTRSRPCWPPTCPERRTSSPGSRAEGAPRVVRALELLESEPVAAGRSRHLSLALLCARWLLDPAYVVGGVTVVEIGWRRIQAAREPGCPRLARPRALAGRRRTGLAGRPRGRRTRWPVRPSSCWTCWASGPSPGWPTRRSPWSPLPGGSMRRGGAAGPGRGDRAVDRDGRRGRRTWPTP